MSIQTEQTLPAMAGFRAGQPLVLDPAVPVHFIGIGGVGMSGLARILLEQGFTVSGSDSRESPYTQMLTQYGATIHIGHAAEHIPPSAQVVLSTAIQSENPEFRHAQSQGLPCVHRSDVLRELVKRHEVSIGLTGTHGKTTMTGMTGLILEAGNLDPTIIAGGKIPQLETNAKGGRNGRYVVAELDESDGSVVQYQPTYSVIANLELDHPDHYREGLAAIRQTFETFLGALTPEHTVLFNMACPVTRDLYTQYQQTVTPIRLYPEVPPETRDAMTYWLDQVVVHLEGGYQGELFIGEEHLGRLWLQVPGRHNLTNAMIAAVIGHRLGIPFETIRRTLENFTGMGRRFEKLGQVNGATIIDDYAHHPTEVRATLQAARELNRHGGRVIALFQPHRYGRLQALWDEFLNAFADADEVILLDVYGAGEVPIADISSERLAKAMPHPAVDYWPTMDKDLIAARLKAILTPTDLLITMGAGDVTTLGRHLVAGAS